VGLVVCVKEKILRLHEPLVSDYVRVIPKCRSVLSMAHFDISDHDLGHQLTKLNRGCCASCSACSPNLTYPQFGEAHFGLRMSLQ
jgi:hypothetical protein